MPERSFGRTVRYRRTKLGLSQAKLAELVGRSASTIRSWERDVTQPNDPKVVSALAAILAVDERLLFEKAGLEMPHVETSPTMEEAFATLNPVEPRHAEKVDDEMGEEVSAEDVSDVLQVVDDAVADADTGVSPTPAADPVDQPTTLLRTPTNGAPGFVTPQQAYRVTAPTPTLADASYLEDGSQRQLYRVRTMATLVALVALTVAFLWAFSHGLGALGSWWDDFFANLKL